MSGPALLAIDSATTRVVVALGTPDGALIDAIDWPAGYRHGETLLPAIDDLLRRAAIDRSSLAAVVVGTGPGAFTGLRVGLATAKGIAHGLGVPIVGVSTAEALLADEPVGSVLLLPAGPSDRLLVRRGEPARVLPAGREPDLGPGETLVAVDLAERAPADAVARGETARAGLAGAARPDRRRAPASGRHGRPRQARARVRHAPTRGQPRRRGGRVVARPSLILRIEPMRMEDLPAVHAIEAASFDAPVAARGVPARPRDEPPRPVPRGQGRRRDRGVRRDVAHGRRGPHHHLRGPPGVAPSAHRRALAARVPGPRLGPRRARGDTGGPPVEPARAPAVRALRVPAGGPPAALLQRQRRGRADHDHRPAGGCRDARADRPAARRDRCRPGSRPARWRIRERRTHPRRRVVVRRDGRRAHRGRPADPRQRRRLAGRPPRADRRDRAGGRGPGPPALDRAGPRRRPGRMPGRPGTTSTRSP